MIEWIVRAMVDGEFILIYTHHQSWAETLDGRILEAWYKGQDLAGKPRDVTWGYEIRGVNHGTLRRPNDDRGERPYVVRGVTQEHYAAMYPYRYEGRMYPTFVDHVAMRQTFERLLDNAWYMVDGRNGFG
jgi:hypothetical protein